MKIRNMERVQAIEVFYDQFNARSLDLVRQHMEARSQAEARGKWLSTVSLPPVPSAPPPPLPIATEVRREASCDEKTRTNKEHPARKTILQMGAVAIASYCFALAVVVVIFIVVSGFKEHRSAAASFFAPPSDDNVTAPANSLRAVLEEVRASKDRLLMGLHKVEETLEVANNQTSFAVAFKNRSAAEIFSASDLAPTTSLRAILEELLLAVRVSKDRLLMGLTAIEDESPAPLPLEVSNNESSFAVAFKNRSAAEIFSASDLAPANPLRAILKEVLLALRVSKDRLLMLALGVAFLPRLTSTSIRRAILNRR